MTVDLHDALEAALAVEGDDDTVAPPPPEDSDGANRLLRFIRYHERKLDEVREVVAKEMERLRNFRADREEIHLRAIDNAGRILEGWTRATITGTKTRTVKLPNGEVRLRPAKVQVATTTDDDGEVARALAVMHPEWVGVEHKLLRTVLGKKDSGLQLGERIDDPKVLEFLGVTEGFEWWTAAATGCHLCDSVGVIPDDEATGCAECDEAIHFDDDLGDWQHVELVACTEPTPPTIECPACAGTGNERLANIMLKVPTRDSFGYTTASRGVGAALVDDEEAADGR